MRIATISTSITALVAVPFLLAGLAGCSQTPSAAETAKTQGEIEKAANDWNIALTNCLREEGLEVTDPKEGEGQALAPGDSNLDVSAVMKRCQASVTEKFGKRPVSNSEKRDMEASAEQQRKVAACVRDKGYDMPDPEVSEDGGSVTSQISDVPEDVMEACGAQSSTLTPAGE